MSIWLCYDPSGPKISDVDTVLRKLPEPTENQLAALTEAVDDVYAKHGLNDEDKVARQDIVTQLELLVRAVVPGKRYTGSTSVCNVFVLIYLYILYWLHSHWLPLI